MYHLAQINIARMLGPIDSPVMAEFAAQLDTINALAEQSPGFIWRLKGDGNSATDLRPFDDDRLIVNMSVWESLDALKEFTYRTVHTEVMKRRREWFEKFPTSYMALWWVPIGHEPSVEEANVRLVSIDQNGDTAFAFTFRTFFSMPTAQPSNSLIQ